MGNVQRATRGPALGKHNGPVTHVENRILGIFSVRVSWINAGSITVLFTSIATLISEAKYFEPYINKKVIPVKKV